MTRRPKPALLLRPLATTALALIVGLLTALPAQALPTVAPAASDPERPTFGTGTPEWVDALPEFLQQRIRADPSEAPIDYRFRELVDAFATAPDDEAAQAGLRTSVADLNAEIDAIRSAAADDDDQGSGAPVQALHNFRPGCDVDDDGFTDMFAGAYGNVFQNNGWFSVVMAISGEDGRRIWSHNNGPNFFFQLVPTPNPAVNIYPVSLPLIEIVKPGTWDPTDVDVNGNGACDVLVVAADRVEVIFTNRVNFAWVRLHWHTAMLDGATGQVVWRKDHAADIQVLRPRVPVCMDFVQRILNWPTNWDAWNTPLGPRYALVTHDWNDNYIGLTCPLRDRPNDTPHRQVLTITNVTVYDSGNNILLWERRIPYADRHLPLINLLRGEEDVMGEGPEAAEREILLDRYNPPNSATYSNNPDDYDCIAKVLRGRDGRDYWETPYTTFNAQTGQFPNTEETVEMPLWCLSYWIDDMGGDGIPDVVGSVFSAIIGGGTSTFNGAFRTHWKPMNGESGQFLWAKDIRTQGWGYLQPTDTRSQARSDPAPSFLAGLSDFPNAPSFGDRFPIKRTRLNLLQIDSGIPTWFQEQEWAQSTNLVWDFTLYQFLGDNAAFPFGHFNGIAPKDLNRDDVFDPLTPADYVQPRGPVQVLLSTQEHRYHAFSSLDQEPVSTLEAWSGKGIAMPCGAADDQNLTVISGTGRRMDLTRFGARTGKTLWRQPLYNDSALQSQSAGVETIFLTTTCQDVDGGRTLFGFNLAVYSFKRNVVDIIILHGATTPNGTLQWVLPELNGDPPLEPSLKIDFLLYAPERLPSAGERMFMVMAPILPGTAVGLGIGAAIGRTRRKRRSKP